MICRDVHVYLFAFLDNELESSLSIELQQHLDRCAGCAREAEIERTIQKRLHAGLAMDGASAGELEATFAAGRLEDRVGGEGRAEKAARPASTRRAWFSRRRAVLRPAVLGPAVLGPAVLAAVVSLAFAGAWMGWNHGFRADRGAASVQPRIVALAVADFRHFEEEGKPLQIASADREEVARWLREKTSIDMVLPDVAKSHWRLSGGRKCTLGGQKAAFAVYESDDGVASVVGLPSPPDALQGLQRLELHGRMLRVHRSGDCTVVAFHKDELVYVAVSRLPAERLAPLLSGADR